MRRGRSLGAGEGPGEGLGAGEALPPPLLSAQVPGLSVLQAACLLSSRCSGSLSAEPGAGSRAVTVTGASF